MKITYLIHSVALQPFNTRLQSESDCHRKMETADELRQKGEGDNIPGFKKDRTSQLWQTFMKSLSFSISADLDEVSSEAPSYVFFSTKTVIAKHTVL